jgi:transposase InsO family protein
VCHKSDAAQILINGFTLLETQTGLRVRAVRSDNGREYVNSTLQDFFSSKGIIHGTTVPYNPQQNGAAQRLNRTLLERTRALLLGSSTPDGLWGAVKTAAYLRNRSPVAGQSKTTQELRFGMCPDVTHLRIFGRKAYVFLPP